MKAADLRKSILQAAVQGKLVPQNPHDEPATTLLERIRKEKSQLIKKGKIKKEKPLPPITEDEIPYDLPDRWAWCRLGEVIEKNTGGGTPSKQKSDYWGGDIPWASVKDMNVEYITKTEDNITIKGLENSSTNLIEEDSIIVCTRMGLGKIAVNTIPLAINQDLRALRLSAFIDKQYFILAYKTFAITGSGMTVKGIKIDELHSFLFPLPPLAEQQRIVVAVNGLMTLCDELEAAEKELDILESNFAEYLPKSILQAAVQGKLVPQNIHDEPADKLLERIKAEKAKLVKSGKLKKEKPLPPITEDEIPYDLPAGWAWCRLGEVISLVSGRDLDLPQINGKNFGIPYITGASAIHNGRVLITRWTEHSCSTSEYGDLLVTCKGTVGKMAFNNVGKLHIARQIMAIRFFSNSLSPEYIKTYIESYVHKLHILAKSIIPGIAREDLLTLPIPLPPLAEQQCIVAKVNDLMALCDALKAAHEAPVGNLTAAKVIPFPQPEDEPEMLMAARGKMPKAPSKALQDARNKLLED